MIDVEKIPDMITKNKVTHVRLYDYNGMLLHELSGDDPGKCADQFEVDVVDFSGYGKIKVKCATEGQFNQSWKNCFEYIVHLGSAPSGRKEETGLSGVIPAGYVSKDYMNLAIQLEALKLQIAAKNDKNALPELPLSWVPVLQGLGMIPEGTTHTPGIAGGETIPPNTKHSVHMTPEEEKDLEKKIEKMNNLMGAIVNKVPIETCIIMLDKLNNKLAADPNFINVVNAFL